MLQRPLTLITPCPKMTATFTGQLILGADKRNPLFTVHAHEEGQGEQLHVYYGLELLEVVSADWRLFLR